MKKKQKKIPYFKTEASERRFWQKHDSADLVDYEKATHRRFPNLKLTSKSITIRLPLTVIERLKVMAHRMDVPYQTLIKEFLFRAVSK